MRRFIDCPVRLAKKKGLVCQVCRGAIVKGEFYHDRGAKVRAHTKCARERAEVGE